MDQSIADMIAAQLADTEQLVNRGVIDAKKLSRRRVFTMVMAHNRHRTITMDDINEWFDANRPDIRFIPWGEEA